MSEGDKPAAPKARGRAAALMGRLKSSRPATATSRPDTAEVPETVPSPGPGPASSPLVVPTSETVLSEAVGKLQIARDQGQSEKSGRPQVSISLPLCVCGYDLFYLLARTSSRNSTPPEKICWRRCGCNYSH